MLENTWMVIWKTFQWVFYPSSENPWMFAFGLFVFGSITIKTLMYLVKK